MWTVAEVQTGSQEVKHADALCHVVGVKLSDHYLLETEQENVLEGQVLQTEQDRLPWQSHGASFK
eukprot:366520-Chlamydomonas_euryale.AAC.15